MRKDGPVAATGEKPASKVRFWAVVGVVGGCVLVIALLLWPMLREVLMGAGILKP